MFVLVNKYKNLKKAYDELSVDYESICNRLDSMEDLAEALLNEGKFGKGRREYFEKKWLDIKHDY